MEELNWPQINLTEHVWDELENQKFPQKLNLGEAVIAANSGRHHIKLYGLRMGCHRRVNVFGIILYVHCVPTHVDFHFTQSVIPAQWLEISNRDVNQNSVICMPQICQSNTIFSPTVTGESLAAKLFQHYC